MATVITPYQAQYGLTRLARGVQMYSTAAQLPPGPPTNDKHIFRRARRPAPPAVAVFSIESQRIRGRAYRVVRSAAGRWTCTCPDYVDKSATDANHRCKHIFVALIEYRGRGVPGRPSILWRKK